MKYLLTILLALQLLLSGCATVGRDFESARIRSIQLDRSTETEIREWFGEPFKLTSQTESGLDLTRYEYVYAKGTTNSGRARVLMVEFLRGRVHGWDFMSALDGDATEFDGNARRQFVIGTTTQAHVQALLGSPSGVIQLPTSLLAQNLKQRAPAETKFVWIYSYQVTVREHGLFKNPSKNLTLYFDAQGVLRHVEYSEESG